MRLKRAPLPLQAMSRSIVIDRYGQVWPAGPWPHLSPIDMSNRSACAPSCAPGALLIRADRNGLHIVLRGDTISRSALYKAVRIMTSYRPRRVVLTQCAESHAQTTIFGGVWEFAEQAETLVAATTP
jgi:hypothetical protein